jgi:hypothetical protein
MAQAVVAVFLAIIAVLSLFGNTLVVILFIKNRQWLKKAHSCLLLGLAVQDILTAIGLLVLPGFVQTADTYDPPQDSTLSQLFCSVVWSRYIPFSLAISSVYTCLMLTVDRWSAVMRPMSYRRINNSAKVVAAMVVIPWVAGFGLEVSAILNVHSIEVNGTFVCSWSQDESSAPRKTTVALVTFFGMILVPAILITIAYVMIIVKLRASSTKVRPTVADLNGQGNPGRAHDTKRSHDSFAHLKKLTRVACAASTIVIICWLPDQLYYCLFQLEKVDFGTPLHDALVILAFMNTMLNPVIYSFSNSKYKDEFKAILCCQFRTVVRQAHFEETVVHHLEERSVETS